MPKHLRFICWPPPSNHCVLYHCNCSCVPYPYPLLPQDWYLEKFLACVDESGQGLAGEEGLNDIHRPYSPRLWYSPYQDLHVFVVTTRLGNSYSRRQFLWLWGLCRWQGAISSGVLKIELSWSEANPVPHTSAVIRQENVWFLTFSIQPPWSLCFPDSNRLHISCLWPYIFCTIGWGVISQC